MTELQIKNDALEAFKKKDYPNAFNILWRLGFKGFTEFSQKEDYKTKKFNWLVKNWKCKSYQGYNYFWNTFILQPDVFRVIFTQNSPVEFLHNYYSKTDIFNPDLEEKLAGEYPEIFIEAIRRNEVFFREDRIEFLLKDSLLSDNYVIHQDVWKSFYETELDIWQQIEAACDEFIMHPVEQVLFVTIEYLESHNYQANFDLLNQATLAETYSFFIELVWTKGLFSKVNLESDEFNNQFNQYIFQNETSNLKSTIFKCLELIKKRLNFKSVFFDLYCFNPEFQPKFIYDSLHFHESPESYYNWSVDELRYIINEQVYLEKAIESSTSELALRMQSLIQQLKDLSLNNFFLKDSSNRNIKVKANILIEPLFGLAFKYYKNYYNYNKRLKNSFPDQLNTWFSFFNYYTSLSIETSLQPFLYCSKTELFEQKLEHTNRLDTTTVDRLLGLFSYNGSKNKKFNRFNVRYSVMEQPFIDLGDHIFSPALFIVNFSGHSVYVNALLKNNNRKTAKNVEQFLQDELTKQNFQVYYPSNKEVDAIDGDADIILFNEEEVLLMQIKRTNLRLDYKSQYYEHINTDLKASRQLNNAENFFKSENKIFNLNNRKVTKWIVSNSFEKVNTTINNCLKVNYLDVMNVLRQGKELSLTDFTSIFRNDYFFKHISVDFLNRNEGYRRLFSLKETSSLNILWMDYHPQKSRSYRALLDEGLRLNSEGKNEDAVLALNQCLEFEDQDIAVHGAIANIYADMGDYNKSFFHFEKALEIIPNEPFITRNYQITLREAGNPMFLQKYLELKNLFPLLSLG